MIATAKPSRVWETCRGCLIEVLGWIRSLALTLLISPTWLPDVPLAAITVGDEADSRVAAWERCWFALRAAAGADLIHRIEHRHPRGRLEFARKDRRLRSNSVVPLFDECQAIREVLLCEEHSRSNFRSLLLHSQTIIFHSVHATHGDQVGRMLLAEEACLDGDCLETDEASARRSSRVEIVRLRTD